MSGDRDLLADLCEQWPDLWDGAREAGEAAEFLSMLTALRAGEDVRPRLDRLLGRLNAPWPPSTEHREVVGRFREHARARRWVYGCPDGTCSRERDRRPSEAPPSCNLLGQPMRSTGDGP